MSSTMVVNSSSSSILSAAPSSFSCIRSLASWVKVSDVSMWWS